MALKQHLLFALDSGAVYPVTLSNVNPLSYLSQRSKIGFLKTALANFAKLTSNGSTTCKIPINIYIYIYIYFFFLAQGVGLVCIRRSEDVQLRLVGVFCAFKVNPVSWESDFIFKLFSSFLLKVDLD